ncbi:hypothetical protein ACFV23_20885, partial [Streptomyces sp. NPDC059627]
MTQSLPGQRPAQEQALTGHGRPPVVVIGAGPYGLSVAAHLRAAGAPVRVFGDVMGSWRHAMATGMYLKSTPDATDLSAPEPGGRLADFRRAHSEPELTELTPIPCDVFVRYGQWFQKRYVGEVEPARVTAVERPAAGPGLGGGRGRRGARSSRAPHRAPRGWPPPPPRPQLRYQLRTAAEGQVRL